STSPPPIVGHNWVNRFLDRHEELSVIKQKSIDILQTTSHDPGAIQRYFRQLR
ncbi:hypothetical protein B0J12DRAFT_553653, partial [Macrophomina phaseolina]